MDHNQGGSNNGGLCYYTILGIEKDASIEQVRAAYRKLALKWHPDRCASNSVLPGDAKVKFQEVQQAYSVLSDESKRLMYDAGVYDALEDDAGFHEFMQELLHTMDHVKDESNSFEDLQRMFVDMVNCEQLMDFDFGFKMNGTAANPKAGKNGRVSAQSSVAGNRSNTRA